LGLVAILIFAACAADTVTAQPVQTVWPSQAVKMLDQRTVVDVRTPAAFGIAHIIG